MKILNLVSGPRNISTALMYSFAQRTDTTVMDEPFYAFYLAKSGVTHPGKEEVLASQSGREEEVRLAILKNNASPILFIKNMAHHMEIMKEPLIANAQHIFLIRNPKQIIASYAQVIDMPVMRDIGIEYQSQLFDKLTAAGSTPTVVDSGLLLQNPPAVLKKLCAKCGIDFQESMLHWEAGPKPYDGIWAKYWYSNVHQSTGFERQPSSDRELPSNLDALYQQAKRYYEKLLPFSLKA